MVQDRIALQGVIENIISAVSTQRSATSEVMWLKDNTHRGYSLFTLLLSDKRYRNS